MGAGAQVLGPSAAFSGTLARGWIGIGAARLKLTHIWGASVTGSGFPGYAAVLATASCCNT